MAAGIYLVGNPARGGEAVARWAQPHPALWRAILVAGPLVVVTWCLVPNHEIACVVVALSMPVLVPWLMPSRSFGLGDMAMAGMVGGTAGGLLGGVIVRLLCAPSVMMPIMMASMAGMVGGTLCGWAGRH